MALAPNPNKFGIWIAQYDHIEIMFVVQLTNQMDQTLNLGNCLNRSLDIGLTKSMGVQDVEDLLHVRYPTGLFVEAGHCFRYFISGHQVTHHDVRVFLHHRVIEIEHGQTFPDDAAGTAIENAILKFDFTSLRYIRGWIFGFIITFNIFDAILANADDICPVAYKTAIVGCGDNFTTRLRFYRAIYHNFSFFKNMQFRLRLGQPKINSPAPWPRCFLLFIFIYYKKKKQTPPFVDNRPIKDISNVTRAHSDRLFQLEGSFTVRCFSVM